MRGYLSKLLLFSLPLELSTIGQLSNPTSNFIINNRHPKSVLTIQQLNSLYLATSGASERFTRFQNLVGISVRFVISLNILCLNSKLHSKRTTNQILANLASSHEDEVLEAKRKAEMVLAAPTQKQASALSRLDGFGGFSFYSDNVAKVTSYLTIRP